jgi:hypothetical protein
VFDFQNYHWKLTAFSIISILLFVGCAAENEGSSSSSSSAFNIGGTVTGLSGVLIIQNNSGDDTVVKQTGSEDVSFTFKTSISSGSAYSVSVKLQPNTQTCTASNASGTTSQNISNITIACTSSSYNVSGTVSGLTGSVVLQNNGADNLTVSNGSFSFTNKINKGSAYNVTVKTQPSPFICSAASNRGLASDNMSSVSIVCAVQAYFLSGTASGLGSTTLGLQFDNETKTLSDNDSFSFSTPVAKGGGYSIYIPSQPDNRTCSVINGTRSNVTQDYTDLKAVCWEYIDNVTSGGINDNVSQNGSSPQLVEFDSTLYSAWVEPSSSDNKTRIRVAKYNDNSSSWSFVDSSGINYKTFSPSSTSQDASQPVLFVEDKTNPSLYMAWIEELAGTSNVTVARYINNTWNYVRTFNKNNQALTSLYGAYHSYDSSPYVTWSELDNVSVSQIRVSKATGAFWDGNGITGINDNTTRHATQPRLASLSSYLYAIWTEIGENAIGQIRVKVSSASSTNWTSVESSTASGINKSSSYNAEAPELTVFSSKLYAAWQESNSNNVKQIRVAVFNGNITSPSWSFVDNGDSTKGLNLIVDSDGNENASVPRMTVFNSSLHLTWLQEHGLSKQMRLAKYNGNDSSPEWTLVDRYDEFGVSRFGLNNNILKVAATPVMAASSSKLYAAWSEPNSSGITQIRVVKNPF